MRWRRMRCREHAICPPLRRKSTHPPFDSAQSLLLLMPFGFPSRWTPDPPEYSKRWLQVGLGCVQLSPLCPFRRLHTFHFLRPARLRTRFWIWRPSFERQRDFNPPEQCAAQHALPVFRLSTQKPSLFLWHFHIRCGILNVGITQERRWRNPSLYSTGTAAQTAACPAGTRVRTLGQHSDSPSGRSPGGCDQPEFD